MPIVPVAVVLVALLSLPLLPVLVGRQVSAVHAEIAETVDPTRTTAQEIQFLLALETAGTRGYLLTGDRAYAARHRDARVRRHAALVRLQTLTARSGPEVRELVAQLVARVRPADAVLDSLYSGRLSREAFTGRLPVQQERLEAVTGLVRQIGDLVTRDAARRVAGLEVAQRHAVLVTVALVALAAVAAILVARLGLAYRALAEREGAARAEADRRRAEAERVAASRLRLTRGFTHDVKNPLGAALGYLTLVEAGVVEPGEGVRHARRTVSSALRLIDELLEIERDESGEIVIRRTPFDLRAAVREVVDDWRALADAKGLALRVETPDDYPPLDSDADRVRQILGNLLSNAVRYTATGAITVRVGMRARGAADPDDAWATVEVCDTGPGLSAEQRQQLFQEFRRLETSAGTGGSGLGLAISKRLADALGGDITVESEPGVGSVFTLLLPCPRVLASV